MPNTTHLYVSGLNITDYEAFIAEFTGLEKREHRPIMTNYLRMVETINSELDNDYYNDTPGAINLHRKAEGCVIQFANNQMANEFFNDHQEPYRAIGIICFPNDKLLRNRLIYEHTGLHQLYLWINNMPY